MTDVREPEVDAHKPLAGKVVIDLTTALAGPYATLLLAGLGATVIKVENPATGGDSSRNNSPYVGADGLTLSRSDPNAMSVSMLGRGRNKKSVTLNLKHPDAPTIFADLVARADIVVENYAAGTAERLGIGYAAARDVNPRIVYASISGYGGQGAPGSGKAMDSIIQALSGVMLTAGEIGGPPVRFGLPVGDLLAPLYAVIGVLAAVLQAEHTGVGQHVDVSMLGALTSLLSIEPFDAFAEVGLPSRTGNMVPRLAPFGVFPAVDGWIALCAPTDRFTGGVFAAMGRPDLAADPRFASRDQRVRHADELNGVVSAWSASIKRADLVRELEANGVPAAEVREPADAIKDELVRSRREVVPLTHPEYGATGLMGPGIPISFSAAVVGLDEPPAQLGQHNDEVYSDWLAYDKGRIDELRAGGVV